MANHIMDLQFHLSYSDACPNAVVEGLMSSLPIICPKGTGTAELLGEIITKTETNNWTKENTSNLANYSLLDKWYYKKIKKSLD